MNWKGCRRRWSWPHLRYYPHICMKGLKETTKSRKDGCCLGWDWTQHLPNTELGATISTTKFMPVFWECDIPLTLTLPLSFCGCVIVAELLPSPLFRHVIKITLFCQLSVWNTFKTTQCSVMTFFFSFMKKCWVFFLISLDNFTT